MLSGASVVVYMKIDQVMIEEMLGAGATGIYAAAVRISEVCYFIPTILAASLFPSIVRTRASDTERYLRRLQQYFSLNAILALAVALPISILSPFIVVWLFGPKYSAAAAILAVHIWASIFVFLGVAREQFLIAEGFFVFSLISTVTGALANVVLNLLLIPPYGGLGAAIATAISYGISAFALSFFDRRTRFAGWMQLRAIFMPVLALPAIFRTR